MNKTHPETGLRRTQLYLPQAARDVLDLDCEILARDERGRAVRKLSDRLTQILTDYADVVRDYMPALHRDDWLRVFAWLDSLDGTPTVQDLCDRKHESSVIDVQVFDSSASEPVELLALSVLDAWHRFRALDADVPADDRLRVAVGESRVFS